MIRCFVHLLSAEALCNRGEIGYLPGFSRTCLHQSPYLLLPSAKQHSRAGFHLDICLVSNGRGFQNLQEPRRHLLGPFLEQPQSRKSTQQSEHRPKISQSAIPSQSRPHHSRSPLGLRFPRGTKLRDAIYQNLGTNLCYPVHKREARSGALGVDKATRTSRRPCMKKARATSVNTAW
jgi:hypothetical protein